MGGKTRGGWIGSTVAGKGTAVMGVTLGVPDLVIFKMKPEPCTGLLDFIFFFSRMLIKEGKRTGITENHLRCSQV